MYVQIKIPNMWTNHRGMSDILINKEVLLKLYATKKDRIKLQAVIKNKALANHLAKAFEIIKYLGLKSFMRGLSIHSIQAKILEKIFKIWMILFQVKHLFYKAILQIHKNKIRNFFLKIKIRFWKTRIWISSMKMGRKKNMKIHQLHYKNLIWIILWVEISKNKVSLFWEKLLKQKKILQSKDKTNLCKLKVYLSKVKNY